MKSVKTIVKKIVAALFPSILERRIFLLIQNLSGSNTYALWKHSQDHLPSSHVRIEPIFRFKENSKFNTYFHILAHAKVVVSTHGYTIKPKGAIYIELWHGMPLKTMGLMDSGLKRWHKLEYQQNFQLIDYIVVCSKFFATVLNACVGIDGRKFIIAGAPRNDLLLSSPGKRVLSRLLGIDTRSKKIILVLPTFRKGYLNRVEGYSFINLLFTESNLRDLHCFLKANNLIMLIKLHPFEESMLNRFLSKLKRKWHQYSTIILINNNLLNESMTDLYEFLNAVDILVTDYSSIYFDFLLLNRPIIFFPIDLEVYRRKRGFLLEPYELWTPGPKVYTQKELYREILKSLNDPSYYAEERERLKNIVHYYQDANSSKRVWEFILELLRRKG